MNLFSFASNKTEFPKKSGPLSLRPMRQPILKPGLVSLAVGILGFSLGASAQDPAVGHRGRSHTLITQEVNTAQMTTLDGHVRPDLKAMQDLGPAEDSLTLRLYFVLRRSPEQQADLDNLIARQQQPGAPEFHQWLTPQQFGERFGASRQDLAKISSWLQSQGIHVNAVLQNASFIDVTATAAQVRQAFHAQLHNFKLKDSTHAALVANPMIPAAIAPAVAGIQGLNKIPRRSHVVGAHSARFDPSTHRWHRTGSAAGNAPDYVNILGDYYVSPQDLYTIYDINRVFNATSPGLSNLGARATIALVEQSDFPYGNVNPTTGAADGGDVATFRSVFGVPGTLNLRVLHGSGSVTCSDPGIDPEGIGEDLEAALDAEWANATAPSAKLIFMSCDQSPDQGINTSLMAIIDNNLADVLSMSYGDSELEFAASDFNFYDTLYSQAAVQGETIFVSSGDSGSDVNDQNTDGVGTSGINVSGFAASPLVTSAGGTDFSDAYDAELGGPPQSNYWGSNNSAYYANALSYVPETAWNGSCAGSLLANSLLYSGAGLCGLGGFANGSVVAGSGGFSTHYSVPAYQLTIPGYSGTKRAQPDIAGFASIGPWGHALLVCDSSGLFGLFSNCVDGYLLGAAGGTSFVAPYMAGVAGLLVTQTGSRQGVLNPALYALAKNQYTSPATRTACYANGQTSNIGVTVALPASSCIFHDVTTGNNDVPCAVGSTNCYADSFGFYGVLSLTNASSLTVAFPAQPGYDEATGLGSIDVYNLLTNWNQAFSSPISISLSANPTTISSTDSTLLSATVTPATNGSVAFAAGTVSLGTCTLSNGGCSLSVRASSLQPGNNGITATFEGNANYPAATSSVVTVDVTGGSQSASASYLGADAITRGTWTGTYGANGDIIANDANNAPSYATVNVTGASTYTWAGPTTDARALQTASGASSRIASTFYSAGSFNISLNLTDGNAHRIALYLLDWETSARSETITVFDANSNAVLNRQTFSNFHNGVWASWSITGNVIIQVTDTAGTNAVVSGIFFDPVPKLSTAKYVGLDTTTQGTWTGVHGADGDIIATEAAVTPSYATVTLNGAAQHLWLASTSDPRGMQISRGSSARTASSFYAAGSFAMKVNLTDGNTHRLALYLLDWDGTARAETLTVTDANTNLVLDAENYSNFHSGVYAIWDIKGSVTITVTDTSGAGAVVAGLFFDPTPSTMAATASYVGTDTSTEGAWTGKYGSAGRLIANDLNNPPSFATVSLTGDSLYTWNGTTTDPRALQISSGAKSGIASTYYAANSFKINVNLTDGNSHKVSLYLLDWDSTVRAETISIVDATSHATLNSQSYSSFHGGAWAVWNVTGSLIIQVTDTSGANAVVSGIFFD